MLKKRIIPCLDIKHGRVVKGIQFEGIRDAGNPIDLARLYQQQGADELVLLDIMATLENRQAMLALVSEVAKEISIPFTVGGGISSIADVSVLIRAGADKISVNSAAIKRPELIKEIAKEFGSQCLVIAIDTKCIQDKWKVYVHGGRTATKWQTEAWARAAVDLGAGEILLTSMNGDGSKAGFSLDITQQIAAQSDVPVIASGGAGLKEHFKTVFEKTKATGALAASIFHYQELSIPVLKNYLSEQGVPVRLTQ